VGDLISILLSVAVLAIDESLAGVSGTRAPGLVAALCPLPHLAALLARRELLAGRFASGGALARLQGHLPLVLHAFAVLGFGWHRTVQDALGAHAAVDWPGPALLVSLAPHLAFSVLAIDARARWLEASRANPSALAAARSFRLRMLAAAVVPLALYLLAMGAIGAIPRLRAEVQWVQLSASIAALCLLGGFALVLPWLLAATWDTAPLEPGPARRVAESVALRAGFRSRELRVWRTGGRVANAAVIGFLDWHRRVLFSDGLLAQLGPRELAAVCAHEYGHALRRHVPRFAVAAAGFVLAADLLVGLASELDALATGATVAIGAALVLAGVASMGYLSRRFELDADLASLEILGDVEALVAALEIAGGPTHARERSGWRHFSTAQRALFLRAAARHPHVGARLRASLARFSRAGLALLAMGIAGEAWVQARGWREQRVIVDLALGDYTAARERAAVDEELPEDTALLVARSADLAGDADRVQPAAIEGAARAAFERGELGAAYELLVLGGLRGRSDMLAASQALDLAAAGDGEEARELARRRAAEWLEELAPALAASAGSARAP
jgi:Zn-dependent protease with chaperone function